MKKLKKGMYVKYIRTMAHDTIPRVDVKDLKIKSVLTREQFNNEKYVVEVE